MEHDLAYVRLEVSGIQKFIFSTSKLKEGVCMLPILVSSRLDGLPACANDGDEAYSLPSKTRRLPHLLAASKERLQKLTEKPKGIDIEWTEDLSVMLAGDNAKVALIHIDGNDLGKLFRKKLEDVANAQLNDSIAAMKKLSQSLSDATQIAFRESVAEIIDFELRAKTTTKIIMPLRPLVMGGDDITLIIRADLALLFLDRFVATFERETKKSGERISVGVGMAIMNASYPFAKAFSLVESLTKNAKSSTISTPPRPSTVDYSVLTEDIENDVADYRRRTCVADDGALLTAKPFILGQHKGQNSLSSFIFNGIQVLDKLPRTAARPAMNACHSGEARAMQYWNDLHDNLNRNLGGRHNKTLMSVNEFEHIFPNGFFYEENAIKRTMLGDYLELAHILPTSHLHRKDIAERIVSRKNAEKNR